MSSYLLAKYVHVVAVIVSGALFFVRGLWMLADSPRLRARWVRIVPHANDTILLAAAVWLAIASRQYPISHDWLTAKILGLLAYILLGMAALRWGKTRRVRITAWMFALGTFGYVVAVAITRKPWPL